MFGRILRSRLFRNTGVYGGAWLLNAMLPFILLPILTRTLSKEAFAIDNNFRLINGYAVQIVGWSTIQTIIRNFYDRGKPELARYIVNCLILAVITLVATLTITYAFSSQIEAISGISREWQWGIGMLAFFTFLNQVVLSIYQVQVQPQKYGMFQIGSTLATFGFSLWFLLPLHLGWQGRVLAQVLGYGIFAIIGLGILWRSGWLRGTYDKEDFRDATSQGSGMVPNNLGSVLFGSADRLVLSNLEGLKASANYSAAYQIMGPIQYVADALYKAWLPWLFERLTGGDEAQKRKIVKITYLIDLGFIGLTAIGLVLAKPVLIWMATDKYVDAFAYLPYVGITYCLYGVWRTRICYPVYAKQMKAQSLVAISAGVLNVFGAWWLIKQFGVLGAGMASVLSASLLFFGTWILAQRVFPMPWNLRSRHTP